MGKVRLRLLRDGWWSRGFAAGPQPFRTGRAGAFTVGGGLDTDQIGGRHCGANWHSGSVCRAGKLALALAPDPTAPRGRGLRARDPDARKISAEPWNIPGTALLRVRCPPKCPPTQHRTPRLRAIAPGPFFVIRARGAPGNLEGRASVGLMARLGQATGRYPLARALAPTLDRVGVSHSEPSPSPTGVGHPHHLHAAPIGPI